VAAVLEAFFSNFLNSFCVSAVKALYSENYCPFSLLIIDGNFFFAFSILFLKSFIWYF